MNKLSVTLIQSRVHWHDAADNRSMFENIIQGLSAPTDIIVLPETFASGFSQQPEVCAETMDGDSVGWMKTMAARTGAAITGSLAIRDQDSYRNRLVFAEPSGMLHCYDKRHLFAMAGENERYTNGNCRVIFEYRGWRICPLICYDLRFPVWSRCRNDYDLLLYVANWPKPRRQAWRMLLRARAIENQCYTIGVNRVGQDGNEFEYAGDSAVVDFLGNTLQDLGDQETAGTVELDRAKMEQFRERFPFAADADSFDIHGVAAADEFELRGVKAG